MSRVLLAYRLGAAAARAVPEPVAYGGAAALGRLAALVAPERRAQVERNIRRVLGPGADDRRVRAISRRTFGSYAQYWVESFRLPDLSPAALDAGITIEGWPIVEDALAAGRGAIIALPHLGGWEWAGFWVATVKQRPISVVVEPLEPAELFDWFVGFREALGMHVIPLGPAAGGDVVRALKANHVVCLLSDRDIGGGGVEVEFFGEHTTLPGGPATLGLRTGAPLLTAAVYFVGRRHHAVVRPPLDTGRTGRLRDDVSRVTQALARELETLIRAAPDQWHLLQPNWPTDLVAEPEVRPRIRWPAASGGRERHVAARPAAPDRPAAEGGRQEPPPSGTPH